MRKTAKQKRSEQFVADLKGSITGTPVWDTLPVIVKRLEAMGYVKRPCGTCYVCGCTDAMACPSGCSWADKEHTLCTSCVRY